MTSSFFSDLDEQTSQEDTNTGSSPFFSDIDKKSHIPKPARLGAQYGIGLLERAALPYDIAVSPLSSESAQIVEHRKNVFEDIERLMEQKQSGIWDEKDEQLLQNLKEQASDTEKSKPFIKTLDISSSGLIEKMFKKFGYDISPEGIEEYAARFTGNIFSPKNIKNFIKSGQQFLTKEGRESFKQTSKWKALEKTAKDDPEKAQILQFAKAKNLTPEETTLLFQSEGKIDKLENIAKRSKKFKEIVSGLREKLQGSYSELKEIGRNGGYIDFKNADKLTTDLGEVVKDINRTITKGPDTEAAENIITKTIENINNNAHTVEDLINARRNLRQFTNWNKLHEGDAIRAKANEAILNSIERANPEVAKRLRETDKAWAKYKKFESLLEKKGSQVKWHGIPMEGLMSYLAFGSAAAFTGGIPLAIKTIALKETVQRVATRLLTDPKFQGIKKRLTNSLMTLSDKKKGEAFTALRSALKKGDKELYQEFEELL